MLGRGRFITARHGWVEALPRWRASAGERARALESFAGLRLVRRLDRDQKIDGLRQLHGAATGLDLSAQRLLTERQLVAAVESAILSRQLLLVGERKRDEHDELDEQSEHNEFELGQRGEKLENRGAPETESQKLVKAALNGKPGFEMEGARYRLCDAASYARQTDREQFQIVRANEARGVISRLNARTTGPGEREALTQIQPLLRDQFSAPAGNALFLLKRVPPSIRRAPDPLEPALTPSQLKALNEPPKKLTIELKIFEAGSGRPLKDTAFLVTKPDGSQEKLRTTAAGGLKLSELDPGQCLVTSVIDGATKPSSFGPGGSGPITAEESGSGPSASASGAAQGSASASGSAAASVSASAAASASGKFGLSISVDALAKGDLKGAISISGGLSGAASGAASAAASASASAAASGAASGTLGGAGALGGAGSGPAGSSAKSPISSAFVVNAEAHRVASGETPESIASQAGVAWDVIAQFNFETTDAEKIQQYFRERVGCTKKSPDGKEYIFDDSDDPGVIYIPKPWSASFAVGEVHPVRVAPMNAVYISLENENGIPLPGAGYQVTFVDETQRTGTLGRSGVARLDGVPEGPFSVAYPDSADLLSRSLAANTRRAFDEQATGPLFYLLGQGRSIIDRAVAIYEEFFDDLTGNGFAADIDQVVTDPDARPPLVFLCKLAGIDIEGTEGVIIQDGSEEGNADG